MCQIWFHCGQNSFFPVVISFPLSSISRFDDFYEMTHLSKDSCQSLSRTTARCAADKTAKLLSLSVFFNPSPIQSLTSSHAAFGFLSRSVIMENQAVIKLCVPLSFINGSRTLSMQLLIKTATGYVPEAFS